MFAFEYELAKREQQVFYHILLGRSNQEIADQLQISWRTVKNQVSNILLKTGKRNREELMAEVIHRLCAEREETA